MGLFAVGGLLLSCSDLLSAFDPDNAVATVLCVVHGMTASEHKFPGLGNLPPVHCSGGILASALAGAYVVAAQ